MPRVAIVTGAATRIGAATAGALHEAGYDILLHYNSSEAAAAEIAGRLNIIRPNSVVTCQASFSGFGVPSSSSSSETLQAACERVVRTAVESFGDIHVLVNSASSYFPIPLVSNSDGGAVRTVDDEAASAAAANEIDVKLDVLLSSNVISPWYLTRAFASHVASTVNTVTTPQSGEEGSVIAEVVPDRCIVSIGDSLLTRPHANHSAYCMAKAALENLVVTSSIELAGMGIRVNCVRPGYNVFPERMQEDHRHHHRQQVPLGKREGTPSDVASAVVYLTDKAVYCTGTFLDVDGGLRHKPIL